MVRSLAVFSAWVVPDVCARLLVSKEKPPAERAVAEGGSDDNGTLSLLQLLAAARVSTTTTVQPSQFTTIYKALCTHVHGEDPPFCDALDKCLDTSSPSEHLKWETAKLEDLMSRTDFTFTPRQGEIVQAKALDTPPDFDTLMDIWTLGRDMLSKQEFRKKIDEYCPAPLSQLPECQVMTHFADAWKNEEGVVTADDIKQMKSYSVDDPEGFKFGTVTQFQPLADNSMSQSLQTMEPFATLGDTVPYKKRLAQQVVRSLDLNNDGSISTDEMTKIADLDCFGGSQPGDLRYSTLYCDILADVGHKLEIIQRNTANQMMADTFEKTGELSMPEPKDSKIWSVGLEDAISENHLTTMSVFALMRKAKTMGGKSASWRDAIMNDMLSDTALVV